MDKHVDFLAILYLTWGALFALTGLASFALALGAAAVAAGGGRGVGAEIAVIILWLSTVMGLTWGAMQLGAGYAIRTRRPWGRTLALVLGILNLFLLPFGTALGIYTCWVLWDEEGQRYFERPAA